MNDDLTAQTLRTLFHYNPDTGIFTRLLKTWPGSHVGERVGSLTSGYVQFKVGARVRKAHRLAWLYMTGDWPLGQIDHIDGDRTNNRWSNLRDATPSANQHNRRLQINNSSGYLGVSPSQSPNKPWRAQISVHRKRINLGEFMTAEEASRAYQEAKIRLHVPALK